jgi:integrase
MPKIIPKARFTSVRVGQFKCPADKDQAFLWDGEAPGLGLRVTRNGARAYVYEGKLAGHTIRMTIGSPLAWTIDAAQAEARRLQTIVDSGRDPRVEKAEVIAQAQATREAERLEVARREVRARDAWNVYCEMGRSRGTGKKPWGELHVRDHAALASRGGERPKRGSHLTEPGPLSALLDEPLADLTSSRIERWLLDERTKRPTRTNLAFRLLRAFLNWCGEQPEYKAMVDALAHQPRSVRSKLPPSREKSDSLQRSQLRSWFSAVQRHGGPVTSSYLQCLLLTGARPNELARLRWQDVSFRWHTLELRDKVAGTRKVPLTNHVSKLLRTLPKTDSPWVFPSQQSRSGHIGDVSDTHNRALRGAGIAYLTPHGLRRSFASLSEWLELPKGVVAQIQGHQPSATAEKHYIRREADLLRIWHNRIERWMLVEAGLVPPGKSKSAATVHR